MGSAWVGIGMVKDDGDSVASCRVDLIGRFERHEVKAMINITTPARGCNSAFAAGELKRIDLCVTDQEGKTPLLWKLAMLAWLSLSCRGRCGGVSHYIAELACQQSHRAGNSTTLSRVTRTPIRIVFVGLPDLK